MATFTYTNYDLILVGDQATAQGTLDVYGLDGPVKGISLEILGFYHTHPNDIDMLLVAPDGEHNFAFMSDTGGSGDYQGFSFGFSDTAAAKMTLIAQGTFLPTDTGTPEDASNWGLSIPVINHPATASFASSFGGADGNGDWSLKIHDDAPNDAGSVAGWRLTVTTEEGWASLHGTAGHDIIQILGDGIAGGVFKINERGPVAYEGLTDFAIESGAGNDLILTSYGIDQIRPGSGRDTVHAGGAVDYITVGDGDDAAGEVYDGGSNNDTLIHNGYQTLDLRDDTLISIERLNLESGGKLMVSAAQMGSLTSVWGGADITHPDELAVSMGASTALNLGLINFAQFFHAGDVVTIKGDKDSESIVGSKVNDMVSAGGGNDFISTDLGRDTIDGGKGNDSIVYAERNVAVKVALDGSKAVGVKVDWVVEDTVRNVENVYGGSLGDVLKGDKAANYLNGLGGADKLKGGIGDDSLEGGLGADSVWGGAGRDTFLFMGPVDAVDHLKDFSHADDTIVLRNVEFAAFAKTGNLSSKGFRANADGHEAHTAKQKLIYDKSDGSLWYDADGKGAGAAIQVAVLDNKPQNLDFHDFLIV